MSTSTARPISVLFLCTGNSARSQMAEGLLRQMGQGRFRPYSAGTEPAARVNPLAEEAMREIGIALDGYHPKSLDSVCDLGVAWDYVITTCDQANDVCPTFPDDTERIHWGFQDPARAEGTHEERLRVFRRVRNEIKRRIALFIALPVHNRAGANAPQASGNARP